MKIRSTLFLALPIIIFSSCDSSRVFEDNSDFEEPIWKSNDPKSFEFNITDNSNSYNLKANIRSSIAYPFHNIYVQYDLLDSVGNSINSELKEFYLFDQKTGEPQGDGLGDIFDNQFLLIGHHQFKATGNYKVELRQMMRLDSLPMILSVGLRVEKVESD
ncbi:MAG: gliding motility lipoprotein GldH [Cyclobacteriaceae bacterium]